MNVIKFLWHDMKYVLFYRSYSTRYLLYSEIPFYSMYKMKETKIITCDCAWTRNFWESVSRLMKSQKAWDWQEIQPKRFEMAYSAPLCYSHTSGLPRFTSTWIYILIAVVGVLLIMKVNKCKSRQRAGNSGMKKAAAIADRNREVCERMCNSNMIHAA